MTEFGISGLFVFDFLIFWLRGEERREGSE